MTHLPRTALTRKQLVFHAALTVAAVLIAFAAFDDITTDTDTSFAFEWAGLAMCAAGLATVSWRLLHGGYRRLGITSLAALAAAVTAGTVIGAGTTPFQAQYLITVAGMLWFLSLAAILTILAGARGARYAARCS